MIESTETQLSKTRAFCILRRSGYTCRQDAGHGCRWPRWSLLARRKATARRLGSVSPSSRRRCLGGLLRAVGHTFAAAASQGPGAAGSPRTPGATRSASASAPRGQPAPMAAAGRKPKARRDTRDERPCCAGHWRTYPRTAGALVLLQLPPLSRGCRRLRLAWSLEGRWS